MSFNTISWKFLDLYFKENPSFLITHHLDSYNDFFNNGLPQLLKEMNPIHFFKKQEKITIDKETRFVGHSLPSGEEIPITFDEMKEFFSDENDEQHKKRWETSKGKGSVKTLNLEEYRYQAQIYMGGKEGNRVYYGKPVIYDENNETRIMYPNEARLRNFNYTFTIHLDVVIEYTLYVPKSNGKHEIQKFDTTLNKVYLGKFPIMVQSDLCVLKNLAPEVRKNMGEDPNDVGGYFIVDGKEKVIVSQEKFADNMLYIQKDVNDRVAYSAKIRSVSEDASKPVRTLSVQLIKEQPQSSNGQIVVSIPNVRKQVPLFIVMRALGVISDKEIMQYCVLDLENYTHYLESLRPCVHDAGMIFTQQAALKYIASLTKGKTLEHAIQILMNYFIPHIGELNFKQKALYLGYIVKRMLAVKHGEEPPTDRDSYIFKRIEISGTLIYDLFREYYQKQQKEIFLQIDKEYFYAVKKNARSYQNLDFLNLIPENQSLIFRNKIVETGFKRAFKGDWGSEAHTKRPGALQDLTRLSFFATNAQLRKTNTPIAADGAKVVGPRLINSTQWGILCPIHSPDGGNVGLHKHISIMTRITKRLSGYPFIEYLRQEGFNMQLLEECKLDYIANSTKIFVNGAWVGVTITPLEMKNKLVLYRRNGLINSFISIHWNIKRNEILIQTDAGRPCHPLFPIIGDEISFERGDVLEKLENKEISWKDCLLGFGNRKKDIDINNEELFHIEELYGKNAELIDNSAIIEYLDTQEMESVVMYSSKDTKDTLIKNNVTHSEIHPSAILSMMANQIIFPSTNPYPRNAFSCGQSKQAVSMFHTNYQNRLDKSAILLNMGQNPLVRSRYYEHITKNNHPYGVNAVVAIMCYTGYNVEDAVIMNRAALDRGLFRTTYFNMYEAEEEEKKITNKEVMSEFMNIENNDVIGLKTGYDYSKLDKDSGLIRENEPVDEKTIVIGKATRDSTSENIYIDESIAPKKGQMGYVDKSILTTTQGGRKLAKIRIRHDRIPMIGDKFCSRAGQKGTIGMVLDEEDMPFTAEGLRPDIIVNPHALPSRMTIGHLVEVLIGKACVFNGNIGDCTAFNNKGPKEKQFGKVLSQNGFHSTGNEIMYNGMTGEQLETEIYFGPTYYLRLKHMVKDKINYRARGPRTVLTRQTVQGRSNNGGLRVGEMDRDAILAHGMTSFIQESMMERGDKYYMAICNQTGTIAVYNESRNIFLSPLSDGPLKFTDNLDGGMNIIPVSKFGRDFSIVKVPYAFKLLYQELQAMNVQMRIITADNVDEVTSMKNSDNIIKLTGLDNLDDIIKNTSEKLVADNEKHLELKRERENNMIQEEQEQRMQQQEYGRDELAPGPPSPDLFLADTTRLPVGSKVNLIDDSQPNRVWTVIEELYTGEEGKYLYIIRTSPPDQIFQLTVPGSKIQVVMPSPPVQGLAPDSPGYVPESPNYSPGTPVFDYKPPVSPNQLEEDNYDYDTEEEYGFYDPGPANLDEIIKEYEISSKIMNEDTNTNSDIKEEDETSPGVDTYIPQQRIVIEKDFNEGLNLLATEDDNEKDENDSGDEDDGDRKSVTA
jgi:DNA-directed RNA polymerase II subunit RPB2